MTCQYTMDSLKSTVPWKWIALAVCVVVALFAWFSARVVSPTGNVSGPVPVVASFYPLAQFAAAVGGDRVLVTTIIPAGVEPHDYEPTPRDVTAVYTAKLFISNGGGLDPWADKIQPEAVSLDVKTLQMASLFELRSLDGTADKPDQAASVDPHIWLDPVLAERQVEAIRDALTTIDPAGKDVYASNTATYLTQLQSLDEQYRSGLADCALDTIVSSHDAFGYLGDRYGFTILPVAGVSPDQEPTLDRLSALIRMVEEQKIPVVFFETLASPKIAQTLAAEAGAKTEVLNPIEGVSAADQVAGITYLSLMQENLGRIKSALECK